MIVVFGSINVDLVARVARLPRPGETIAGESFAVHPGGKGANQALAARRAGAEVALAGAIGEDSFAPLALHGLADAGVDLTRVRRVAAHTGVALIHVDTNGENAITIVPGANASADPAVIEDALLVPGTTVVLQLEVPMPAVLALAQRAHARGARVILNAAPAQALPLDLIATLDALIVNETEAAAIAAEIDVPASPEAFAVAIHRCFGCATVVTQGAQGALVAVDATVIRASAPTVCVIDTTGAGDAFAGALAAALDRGLPWPRALARGVAAGALACTVAGARTGISDASDIERLAATVQSTHLPQPLEGSP